MLLFFYLNLTQNKHTMPEAANIERPNQLNLELKQSEGLHQRTEQALDDCDFVRTPELERSMEGFYATHYQLASVMRLGLQERGEQRLGSEDERAYLNGIIDNSYFDRTQIEGGFKARLRGYGVYRPYAQQVTPLLARVRLARLESPDDPELRKAELSVLSEAGRALFAEASVGVTTLTSKEADLIISLQEAVVKQIKESGLFPHLEEKSEEELIGNPLQSANDAIDTFRRDSRFAGQLLFHNTGHFQDLSSRGEILPRRMQQQRYGTVNFQTAEHHEGHIHSPTPHWSESFDPKSYRGDRAGTDGGTVAVPLAKIIRAAPYARDAQYGVLTLKPEAAYMTGSIRPNDRVANIGDGGPDRQGIVGDDRTFYSSPYDVPANAPIEEAPDGYTIPLDKETYWVRLEDKDKGKTWGSDVEPEQYIIPVQAYLDGDLNGDGMSVAVWRERRNRTIARSIRELQEESIRHYPNELVVPLRAGVMDFYAPDDSTSDGKKRAQFTRIT